jgi:hypothetical protein
VKSTLVPVIVAFLLAAAPGVNAASAVLTPVADTTLFESTPNNNLGVASLAVGATAHALAARALLRFDVSGIPSNATVTSVILRFVAFRAALNEGVASSFRLHRFLSPWTEGTGIDTIGSPAQPGETTWLSQFHGSALWSQPGSAVDVDYSSTISSSVPINPLPEGQTAPYAFESTVELLADVQAWVSQTTTNHGWIMISSDEETPTTARRLFSREDPTFPPMLEVEYTLPPADPIPQFTSAAATSASFELRFTVPSTYCYEVQYHESLVNTNWSALTNICAPVLDVQAVVTDSLASPQRFYRLWISDRVR